MNRLIDTMGFFDLGAFIEYLASAEADLNEPEMRQELEKLFAPAPHWSDNLDVEDKQMNRVIDTMGFFDLGAFIEYLASAEADLDEPEMRQELEKLFAPALPGTSRA